MSSVGRLLAVVLASASGALVVASIASSTAATPTDAQSPAACSAPLLGAPGVAGGSDIEGMTGKSLASELGGLHALGARWLRIDVDWSIVQQNPSRYDWSSDDPPIRGAIAQGINVDGDLVYTPSWAKRRGASSNKIPPTNAADYGTFAAAAVRHYAPLGVHTWEIWNEPNNPDFWNPRPDVARYASLLKAAYAAIKGVDPTATVIVGGLSTYQPGGISPVDFLTRLYANGSAEYFDAVADHPYTYPDMPDPGDPKSAWSQMNGSQPSLHSLMVAHGDGDKRIWITEYGAPGRPGELTEDQQAEMITRGFRLAQSSPWAGPLFIYGYKDLGTDTSTENDFFGLLRYDGSRKPSWKAFKAAADNFTSACDRAPRSASPPAPGGQAAPTPPGAGPPAGVASHPASGSSHTGEHLIAIILAALATLVVAALLTVELRRRRGAKPAR